MKEITGDFWGQKAGFVVLPTNCKINKNGSASMGRGIAREATKRFGPVDKTLGKLMLDRGVGVFYLGWFNGQRLFSFPVRGHWRDSIDPRLVSDSCQQLLAYWQEANPANPVVIIPKLDCSSGRADWQEIKALMGNTLKSDKFIVVSPPAQEPTENS